MPYRLPHVLVLFNLSRRPAILPSDALRRAVVLSSINLLPACLPRVFSPLFCPFRFSTRRARRFDDGHRLLAIAMAMLMSSDVVRLRVPRFAYAPSAYRPASSTRVAGRGTAVRLSLLASLGFLPSDALVSVRV